MLRHLSCDPASATIYSVSLCLFFACRGSNVTYKYNCSVWAFPTLSLLNTFVSFGCFVLKINLFLSLSYHNPSRFVASRCCPLVE